MPRLSAYVPFGTHMMDFGVINVAVRRAEKRIRPASSWDGLTQLAVLAICFAVGTMGGFFLSVAGGEEPELLDYLGRYFQSASQGNGITPALGSTIWDLGRWPAIVFLLGLTSLGVVGIPMVVGMRGFLLSYAATTFARLFHLPGVMAALTAFGVTALVSVPILFIVAADAFRQSLSRLPGAPASPDHWSQRTAVLAPSVGLLVLAVALQQTVMPALFSAVCTRLLVS